MHIDRQGIMRSASRRAQRAKKTSGRIVVSAVGFGLAYYFDTENGGARRAQLRDALRRAAGTIDSALSLQAREPPPTFAPLLRGLGGDDYEARWPEQRVGAG